MQYSIVNYKTVQELKTFRIDAEYFHPEYLRMFDLMKQKKDQFSTLSQLKIKCDASAFYPTLEPYYGKGDVPFIRVADVNEGVNYNQILTIPRNILDEYKTLSLGKKGDIVLTKGGSIARAGLITRDSALTRDLIFFNTSKLNEGDYIFYYVYCLTDFYKKQLVQSSSMTAQPHLTITLVKYIPFFSPNKTFKTLIVDLYQKSSELLESSKSLYSRAEQLLLSELDLQYWQQKKALTFEKKFSDTEKVERFDSEYFQPMYEELEKNITKYKNGFDYLEKVINILDKNFNPENDQIYKYIELANISNHGEINGYVEDIGSNLPTRARRKVKKGDVIVSTIEGSLDCVAMINDDMGNALCSTGFNIINSKNFNSETLLCLMKSLPIQLQLKKACNGTILTAIGKKEFNYILIPLININIQQQIKSLINAMYISKQKSKKLLEIAKKAVEKAIEEDEEKAISYINEELNSLNIKL